jgi:hypothetical protein
MSTTAAIIFDGAVAVTTGASGSDPNVGLSGSFAGLWIGVGGTISFLDALGVVSATTVGVGLFPVRVVRVNTAGTSATGILGFKSVP